MGKIKFEPIYLVDTPNKVPRLVGKLPGIYRTRVPSTNSYHTINRRGDYFVLPGYRYSYGDRYTSLAVQATGDWYNGS